MHPEIFIKLNQGKVSSHFLLHLLIPDPDLEGGFKVELEQSESLELETTEDFEYTLEIWTNIHFCFVSLWFNLYIKPLGKFLVSYMNLIIELTKTY